MGPKRCLRKARLSFAAFRGCRSKDEIRRCNPVEYNHGSGNRQFVEYSQYSCQILAHEVSRSSETTLRLDPAKPLAASYVEPLLRGAVPEPF